MSSVEKPCVGFVGLGKMGMPMARQLVANGYTVYGCDYSPEATRRAVEKIPGAHPASFDTIAKQCHIIILMLPDSTSVEAVLFGSDPPGLASQVARGTIIIDMGSSDPSVTRAFGEKLAEIGVGLVDAPVSGGVKRAVSGTLSIMVGGNDDSIAPIHGLLSAMGSTITRTGPLGSAHAMKALNNYVSAAGLVAACEALRIGQAFGLEPENIVAILNSSTGKNNSTENKLSQFVVSRKFDSGFSLGLMKKDLSIALGLAKEMHIPTAIGDSVLDAWRAAEERFGKGADHTEIYKILEED